TTSNYTLLYPQQPSGDPVAAFPIRAPGPTLGTAFDAKLDTAASNISLTIPVFIRSIATTDNTAQRAPQNNGVAPTSISFRAYDAANNPSNTSTAAINPLNINSANPTNFTAPQSNGAVFIGFAENNAAANISNCPAAGCTGGAAPANPTTVSL